MLQYTVRKRRSDLPQLEYPDCYDEYDGRIPTGKIVKSISPLVYLDVQQEKEIKKDSVIQVVKDIPKLIKIHHQSGISIVEYEGEFSIDEYTIEIEKKFWKNFVISIEVI